jgi:hypothetical protein
MTALRQIPEDGLRTALRAAAVLQTSLDELANRAEIRPETRTGNLGRQRDAVLEADDGTQYMVVEFCDEPTQDVELRVEERATNPDAAIDRFLESVALPSDLVIWRVSDSEWGPGREGHSGEDPPAPVASDPADDASREPPGVGEPRSRSVGEEIGAEALIDKLADLVHRARSVPLTNQVRINKKEVGDIVDALRGAVFDELDRARSITDERRQMLARAKQEAERIVIEAHERQGHLISEHEVTVGAEGIAERIIEGARREGRELRDGADKYADDTLRKVEVTVGRLLASIGRGRDRLAGEDGVDTGPGGSPTRA